MPDLPAAEHCCPSCGACGAETTSEDDCFACYDCRLMFEGDDLTARFLDPDAEVCGEPCSNTWHHRRGAIWADKQFVCHPCQLPKDHNALFHWTGCVPVPIDKVS